MSPFTVLCLFAVVVAAMAQDATTVAPPKEGTTKKAFFCNEDSDCDRHCAGYRGFCGEKDHICHHCEAPESLACESELECLRSCRHSHELFGICFHKKCRCAHFG